MHQYFLPAVSTFKASEGFLHEVLKNVLKNMVKETDHELLLIALQCDGLGIY